jgi:integrase
MAYYRKRSGGWQAQVEKSGVRDSDTFPTKAHAIAWATKREAEIMAGVRGDLPKKFVFEALKKYSDEISINKKGKKKEIIRINDFLIHLPFKDKIISEVDQSDIAAWRDGRLQKVAPSTVNRDWNLLHSIFQKARKEWRWLKELPFADVSRPKNPRPRNRRVMPDEVRAMCEKLGYSDDLPITTKRQEVALAFQLGIESGMRMGEIISLHPSRVDTRRRVVRLIDTKNADSRDVPLSARATYLLEKLADRDPVFTISARTLDGFFREAREAVSDKMPDIASLHFHDSRHEACTRLAQKLSVLELARVIGHRDLKSLMIYFNPTTEELAAKLG